MKRLFLIFVIFCMTLIPVKADSFDIDCIKYKPLKDKSKITYDELNGTWSDKINKKNPYFIKTKILDDYYEYQTPQKETAFITGASYEFIKDGALIGYSNKDFRFYEYEYNEGNITARELSLEEVEKLLPDVRIIAMSEFNKNTNSIKIKKTKLNYYLFIYNDTDVDLEGYEFTSGNAKFETFRIRGLINITKKGMIQFSGVNTGVNSWVNSGVNQAVNPDINKRNCLWYVIMVR